MKLKRLKFIVQGVAVELDETGQVLGERLTKPQAFYSPEQVMAFLEEFDRNVSQESSNGAVDALLGGMEPGGMRPVAVPPAAADPWAESD